MLDTFSYGVINRQSPEAPVPIVELDHEEHFAGGAANVVSNLNALGVKSTLLSAIGDDGHGRRLQKLLDRSNIHNELIETPGRQTTYKQRIIAGGAHQLRLDAEQILPLNEKEIVQIQQYFDKLIMKVDGVILQDYNKGVLTEDLIAYLQEKCEKLKIPVFADPKEDNFFTYKKCFLFKPNWREVCLALDINANDLNDKSLQSASERLVEQLQCEHLVITLGSQGIFYHSAENNASNWVKGIPAEVKDVSGAGDTVIAVLAASLLSSFDLPTAVDYANLAGKLVCEKPGIAKVMPDNLTIK